MNIEQAFWEMLAEIGGSSKELRQLEIDVSFYSHDGSPTVHLWAAKLGRDGNSQLEIVESPDVVSDFSMQVIFHSHYVDLHDPESFEKLKVFLEVARKQSIAKHLKGKDNADL